MSNSKIQIKIGIVEFSGEGEQDWLGIQLDKIIAKVPELLTIELLNSPSVYIPAKVTPYSGAIFPPCSRSNSGHAKSEDSYCFERSKI